MTTTHRLRDGGWAECAEPEACELPFHLPDTTPERAAEIPLQLLLPLFEIIDPPTSFITTGATGKIWANERGAHRDFDLPARVFDDGTLVWCQNGHDHREGDKPALIKADGTMKWFRYSSYYARPNGGPVRIEADGTLVYMSHYRLWREQRAMRAFLRRMSRYQRQLS